MTSAMITLRTQKQLRQCQSIDFCCLCGRPLASGEPLNRHHIPPEAIFRKEDREPLVLPVHKSCNDAESTRDEPISQLIRALRGEFPADKNKKLRGASLRAVDGGDVDAMVFPEAKRTIFRWVKCFHAAMYRQYLDNPRGKVFLPIVEGTSVAGFATADPPHRVRIALTAIISRHMRLEECDSIVCNKGNCEYHCIWKTFSGGRSLCIFALRVYDWERLTDPRFEPHGCVGFYEFPAPHGASYSEWEEVDPNFNSLDPFAALNIQPVTPPASTEPGPQSPP